jgi:hypothetical protein
VSYRVKDDGYNSSSTVDKPLSFPLSAQLQRKIAREGSGVQTPLYELKNLDMRQVRI